MDHLPMDSHFTNSKMLFFQMSSCSCSRLDDFYEPHPDEECLRILSSFKKIKSYEDIWLGCCKICQQFWIVNSVSRGPLIVKVASDSSLERFDEGHYRKLCYLKSCADESEDECIFRNCSNNAVRNMAICVDHALD